MDATQTRTVAEVRQAILSDHPDSWEAEQIRHHQAADIVFGEGRAPDMLATPDDMLAFLRDDFHIGIAIGDDSYSVAVTFSGEDRPRGAWTAPTLHAALEQAVIAVGGVE